MSGPRYVTPDQRGLTAALPAVLALWCLCCDAQPIAVQVEKRGETIVVDVQATVAAESRYAWAVLTDYDHMAQFVSTLKSSAIVRRQGNSLQVEQRGEARLAFLHFSFHTIRAVELVPGQEIRSQLITGDFKSYGFTTRVTDMGDHTLITHHGEYVPNTWVPPGVGPSLIKAETEKQYKELMAEMVLRQGAAAIRVSPPSATAPSAR